ncbi:shikimate dehydrogenase family protein [Bosea vaviloviae]|uniref:shikimate dehydrogenase family protein n=1 Tax=Bosea vaviloviae TaxID=1526658 RepID=UPI000B1855F2|nr:shikimate dehydrogenase [Bosea vaviloviae]
MNALTGRSSIPCPSGATRLFAVIGDPVAQVMAPELMNPLFLDRGCDAVLTAVEVKPEHLSIVLAGLKQIANLDGILVTVPHKFAVCSQIDAASEAVTLAGSANALRREPDGSWRGDNFDGAGFVRGLQGAGHDPSGKVVSLVGAGGAGVSVAAALMIAGARRLHVTDLSAERAGRLVDRLSKKWPGRISLAAAPDSRSDIVVNATPLGLVETDPLPFDPALLSATAVVADIIMKPAETRLLKAAAEIGLPTHPGIHMLTNQVELYREFFRIP